ncbi:NADH-quinone oxidoreductase subunit F [Ktedonosporobacter rubrisoli]|uniref:NADH-quinone oxidoreductase subunit F n=1 Tax=Ktedonosporobacter rubrisoli TaxID=2509675 RepID=A0A4P6K2Y8_KTERU|nr:NADH-ubiquinone oxidoreductase-F iron-sulfur binding region domain-containing protein [Ktedonosporobacter rubrisoli]QBD82395.1 NADH-quinone oxidoreductase subunit F [Ktedonosporobacter rubrisoli]
MPDFKKTYRVLRLQDDPDVRELSAYRSAGGYAALEKAIREQSPEQVIQQVVDAKLRGRGGAGRLTGEKWRIVRQAEDNQKYVICNAYDADSRSLLARSLLEHNPHQVIEGIVLAAYAVGASEAYLFTRSLYREGVETVRAALQEAVEANLVGRDILGTDYSCNISVLGVDMGFMGGEETVQIALIKGRRGMPEQRPPYPAQYGLWDKPTAINNIETLANVPLIVRDGASAFSKVGTSITGGTKVLTVYDYAPESKPAVVEVPFGTTLRDILTHAGLSHADNEVRAVVVGGAEGGALPTSLLDTPYDFDPLENAGTIVGSSVIELLPINTCMVAWALERNRYLSKESCGKCVPCRLGVKRIAGILEGIVSDLGVNGDLEVLDEFAEYVPNGSLCGFGVQAPNSLKTAKRYWPEHFTMHIQELQCPTGTCVPVRAHRFVTKHVLP